MQLCTRSTHLVQGIFFLNQNVASQPRGQNHEQDFNEQERLNAGEHMPKKVENDARAFVRLVSEPIWRGSFSIPNIALGAIDGLQGHLFQKEVCSELSMVTGSLPQLLHLNVHQKIDVWPENSDECKAADGNMSLCIHPENDRSQKDYDGLLEEMITYDCALTSEIGDFELMVFTSLQLPVEQQKNQGKYYLCGLFSKKRVSRENLALLSLRQSSHIEAARKATEIPIDSPSLRQSSFIEAAAKNIEMPKTKSPPTCP
ncbi:hypothetical protein Ancab_036302 [Ancistrocladus abbreviatus]